MTRMSRVVGIGELLQHAGKVVADAVASGPVAITRRGRAGAMVVPLAASGLEDLRAQVLVTPALRRVADLPAPIGGGASLTDTLERVRDHERY